MNFITNSFNITYNQASHVEPLTWGVLKIASFSETHGDTLRKAAVISIFLDQIIKVIAVPFIEIEEHFNDIINEEQLGIKIIRSIITPIWLPIKVAVKTALFALYFFTAGLAIPYRRIQEILSNNDVDTDDLALKPEIIPNVKSSADNSALKKAFANYQNQIDLFIENIKEDDFYFNIIRDIKNAETVDIIGDELNETNKIIESYLQDPKIDRIKLHLVAYALFSGERKFFLMPPCGICLLYMIHDPLSRNEEIIYLIRRLLEELKIEKLTYPAAIKTDEQNDLEKGIYREDDIEVEINHGGGLFHILGFTNKLSTGYRAPGEYEGSGLFVYANGVNETKFYAHRSVTHFDIPAQLDGRIAGNLLGTANVKHECVLRTNHVEKFSGKLTRVPLVINEIPPSKEMIRMVARNDEELMNRILASIQTINDLRAIPSKSKPLQIGAPCAEDIPLANE